VYKVPAANLIFKAKRIRKGIQYENLPRAQSHNAGCGFGVIGRRLAIAGGLAR